MITHLRISLTGDGPSDRSLLPIIVYLLSERLPDAAVQPEWADLSRLPVRQRDVKWRIENALEFYPCDVLFVHRDAENEQYSDRVDEIQQAIMRLGQTVLVPIVPVIPVRMQEAWLLMDEQAIRRASGNPNGRMPLNLPSSRHVEHDPDPKETLHALLRLASGLSGRKLDKFSVGKCSYLVSECIMDFKPLLRIPAVARLKDDIHRVISKLENGNQGKINE